MLNLCRNFSNHALKQGSCSKPQGVETHSVPVQCSVWFNIIPRQRVPYGLRICCTSIQGWKAERRFIQLTGENCSIILVHCAERRLGLTPNRRIPWPAYGITWIWTENWLHCNRVWTRQVPQSFLPLWPRSIGQTSYRDDRTSSHATRLIFGNIILTIVFIFWSLCCACVLVEMISAFLIG